MELLNLDNPGGPEAHTYMWFLLNGPSLITFTIACVFAYFWHEIYRGFDDSIEEIEKANEITKRNLIIINIVAYLAFIFTTTMYILQSSANYLIASVSIVLAAMALGTGFIIYHGNKLHTRVMKLIKITS